VSPEPLCSLCNLPADRGPYVLRLDAYRNGALGGTRATSATMDVCRLCDTSPVLLEQLAFKLTRGKFPTRGEHAHERPMFVMLESFSRADGTISEDHEKMSGLLVNVFHVVSLTTELDRKTGERVYVLALRGSDEPVYIDQDSARRLCDVALHTYPTRGVRDG
jgi:hypothetical protein